MGILSKQTSEMPNILKQRASPKSNRSTYASPSSGTAPFSNLREHIKDKETNNQANNTLILGNPYIYDPDAMPIPILPNDPLVLGAFIVYPRIGTLEPGQRITIDVKFNPQICDIMKERIRIAISGVDHRDMMAINAKVFDLSGESCYPAIVNTDFNTIFEEQEVITTIDEYLSDSQTSSNPSINLGETLSLHITPKIDKLAIGKVLFAQRENLLAFGPVMCNPFGSNLKAGVTERIKISNPTKVDTTVRFKIVSSDAAVAAAASNASSATANNTKKGVGAKATAPAGKNSDKLQSSTAANHENDALAFTIQPSIWEIPAHEHRYVNICFNPTEIKNYRSTFYAEVDYANDQSGQTQSGAIDSTGIKTTVQDVSRGKVLSFDLLGAGTLPCIVIEQPVDRRAIDGMLQIDFGKVLSDRSSCKKIIIRNDGIMPAICSLKILSLNDISPSFYFEEISTEEKLSWDRNEKSDKILSQESKLTLQSHERKEITVKFLSTLSETGSSEILSEVRLSVADNDYANDIIQLKGTSYSCDASLDIIKDDINSQMNEDAVDDDVRESTALSNDEFTFPDINLSLGKSSSTQRLMLNSQSQHPVRYEFSRSCLNINAIEEILNISPSIGHLQPNESKEICVTMTSTKPLTLKEAIISCSLTKIEYTSNESSESWDNSMKIIRVATEEDLQKISAYEEALKEYKLSLESPGTANPQTKGKKATSSNKKGNASNAQAPVALVAPTAINLQLGSLNE